MGTIMNRKLMGILATALAFGSIQSCSGGAASDDLTGISLNDSTADESRVASATVTLARSSLITGDTTRATAVLLDQQGLEVTRVITWSSGNVAIATVNAKGLVRARGPGATAITGTRGLKSGSANLTVTDSATAPPTAVASVSVVLGASSLSVGGTTQAVATTRDSSNNILTGRPVAWTSTVVSVATISGSGLGTALAAGATVITASSEGKTGTADLAVVSAPPPPPPPPPGATVDPTLLPKATSQRPMAGTYGRNLAAGQTYIDPNTGVLVLKLTSASVPNSNGGVYHGYSEGGPFLSQQWVGTDGNTYYTAYLASGWLVDIRYDTFASSNWRTVPIDGEINFAFSLNPATPRIGYYIDDGNNKTIHRYNTATNSNADTGIFPYTTSAAGSSLSWLQVNLNDGWLVGMLNSNSTIVGVRISDGLERIIPRGTNDVDEPHIDREFPIVYISTNNQQNIVVNLETGAVVPETDPQGVDVADHEAPLRGKVVAVQWTVNGIISTSRTGNVTVAVTPSPTDWSGDWHMAGQWVWNNPSEYFLLDQWANNGNYAIRQGMIGLVSIAGDVRLLVAHNATGTGYDTGGQVHPTFAPDGKLVMWTSNMSGSGRYDVFVARVPTR